jgi:hypothetical protein
MKLHFLILIFAHNAWSMTINDDQFQSNQQRAGDQNIPTPTASHEYGKRREPITYTTTSAAGGFFASLASWAQLGPKTTAAAAPTGTAIRQPAVTDAYKAGSANVDVNSHQSTLAYWSGQHQPTQTGYAAVPLYQTQDWGLASPAHPTTSAVQLPGSPLQTPDWVLVIMSSLSAMTATPTPMPTLSWWQSFMYPNPTPTPVPVQVQPVAQVSPSSGTPAWLQSMMQSIAMKSSMASVQPAMATNFPQTSVYSLFTQLAPYPYSMQLASSIQLPRHDDHVPWVPPADSQPSPGSRDSDINWTRVPFPEPTFFVIANAESAGAPAATGKHDTGTSYKVPKYAQCGNNAWNGTCSDDHKCVADPRSRSLTQDAICVPMTETCGGTLNVVCPENMICVPDPSTSW